MGRSTRFWRPTDSRAFRISADTGAALAALKAKVGTVARRAGYVTFDVFLEAVANVAIKYVDEVDREITRIQSGISDTQDTRNDRAA